GSALALPVWTEFMKRAVQLPQYSDVKPFVPPAGVVRLTLDKNTNQVATPACPDDYTSTFIDGTQPTQTCDQTGSAHGKFLERVFGLEPKPSPPPPVSNRSVSSVPVPGQPAVNPPNTAPVVETEKTKKKGFWGRLFGGSKEAEKGDNKEKKPAANSPD